MYGYPKRSAQEVRRGWSTALVYPQLLYKPLLDLDKLDKARVHTKKRSRRQSPSPGSQVRTQDHGILRRQVLWLTLLSQIDFRVLQKDFVSLSPIEFILPGRHAGAIRALRLRRLGRYRVRAFRLAFSWKPFGGLADNSLNETFDRPIIRGTAFAFKVCLRLIRISLSYT